MDLRKKKTLRAIKEAFFTLLKQKSLEKITVTELAKLAEISKATFYLHYNDVFDLSESLQKEVIQKVLNHVKNPLDILQNPNDFMLKLIRALELESASIEPLFSGSQAAALPISIESSLKECIFSHSPEYKKDVHLNVYLTYHIYGGYYSYMQNVSSLGYKNVMKVIQEIQEKQITKF